jgi:ribosomal protein S18 acetylase RimI-like enzyme
MIELESPLRLATEQDAKELAELVNFAGEGMPLHIWQGLAEEGQNPWEIGQARQAEKARQGQIIVVDFGKGAVASLTGYSVGPAPEPIGNDVPDLFRPLLELENEALDSWYVNVLACYPEYRGQGIGSRLLDVAERIARDEGLRRMSVVVADNNTGARRLYERQGYEGLSRRPCLRGDWATDTEDWVLLMKSLPEAL